jgi:hypothetical protein
LPRRRPPVAAESEQVGDTNAAGVPIMPRELTLARYSEWPSHVEWCRRQRAWLREHGVDPADWNAVSPIRNASRRVHAERVGDLPALDRARLRALEGRRSADPV